MWGTLSVAGKLAATRRACSSSSPLLMRQPINKNLFRKVADTVGPYEISWDVDNSEITRSRAAAPARTSRTDSSKKASGSLNLVSTSAAPSPRDRQLEMERGASLERWDWLGESPNELSRTRQRDIEVATITKEMEKQGSRRGVVMSIGRGTAFKESLDFARAWVPALIDHIKISILPMNSNFRLLTNVVSPEKIAVITLDRMLGKLLAHRQGVTQHSIMNSIADALQAEFRFLRMKKTNPKLIVRMQSSGKPLTVRRINRMDVDEGLDVPTDAEVKRLAGELFNTLVDLAKVDISTEKRLTALVAPQVSAADQDDEMVASGTMPMGDDPTAPAGSPAAAVRAFLLSTSTLQAPGGKTRKVGWIALHAAIFDFLTAPRTLQQVAAQLRNAPMLIPPHPWTGPSVGPYLITPVPLMRTKNKLQLLMLQKPDTNLETVCRALNVLGATPWKINKLTLAVVQEAWNNGGGIADLPPRADLSTPPAPQALLTNNEQEALRALYDYKKQVRRVDRINSERHSLRCDFLLKLGVAETYVKEERFYFPHNLDFRGRAYPVPPHLNHIGADLARGLLKFAEGRALGKEGLTWMKVHLSNTVGYDKVPFEARVAFVEENLPMIFDSADRPLNGGRWWLKADSPWQCLAACIELTAALRSPDPTAYVSNLPIHQDGSCNGLQHYAALGGDVLGAEKVNMLPADRPQDLYASVADLVAKRVDNEAQRGDDIAKLLRGKVSRKVIKQTVMTSVYGVTFVGARDQIRNAIKDLKVVAEEHYDTAALYLARLTFDALREMFFGAKAIMEWLGECATRISKNGRPVTWITPMGLPVVQPYMKPKTIKVATLFQDVALYDTSERVPINNMKQKSAFPPNYIHSLDSTHMFYTALECHKQGLTFASVHDSFWTHACAIPQMSKILREQFINLHTQPLLENLLSRWQKLYPNIEFPPFPKRGPLDLNRLLESKYFFH